ERDQRDAERVAKPIDRMLMTVGVPGDPLVPGSATEHDSTSLRLGGLTAKHFLHHSAQTGDVVGAGLAPGHLPVQLLFSPIDGHRPPAGTMKAAVRLEAT